MSNNTHTHTRAHTHTHTSLTALQVNEANFFNLAVNTIEALSAAKNSADLDAFTKAFMPAFEKYCVLPYREREIKATMGKIEQASDIVTSKEVELKAEKEKMKARKRLSHIRGGGGVESSDVARGTKRQKSSVGKAIASLSMLVRKK